MLTKPRRSIAEYKKHMGETRLRRKFEEMPNQTILKQTGLAYMKSEQSVLMGCMKSEQNALMGCLRCLAMEETGPTMPSIVVDAETKPSQGLLHHTIVTGTVTP